MQDFGGAEQGFSAFWKKVVALHAQILGWVELPRIYNNIGFLIASGNVFGKLALAAKGKKKSEFNSFLVDRMYHLTKLRMRSGLSALLVLKLILEN